MWTPGCFLDTSDDLERGKITTEEFLQRCFEHFGPEGVRHPKDSEPIAVARKSWRKDPLGLVASALALCLADPLASTIKVDALVPLFMTCIGNSEPGQAADPATIEDFADNPDAQIVITSSPLFLQAVVAAAISGKRWSLAQQLIRNRTPPPADQCLFDMHGSPLTNNRDIPSGVWTVLVRAGWVLPNNFRTLVSIAASSPRAEDGIALFDAMRASGLDLTANPYNKEALPPLALATTSGPTLVQYLWDALSMPETLTNNSLVEATLGRESGGIEMLGWLLDKGLDVNWLMGPTQVLANPRERAESESWRRSKRFTALHAAAANGNADAVQFLLGRGASADIQDEFGRTPRDYAEFKEHAKIVRLLDEHQRARDGEDVNMAQ